MEKNETALSLWASAIYHSAGLAAGHPLTRDALRELASAPDIERYLLRHRAKIEDDVLCAIELVERTLQGHGAADWFRAYLLFKYPIVGRYEPERQVRGKSGARDEPARAFVDAGHFSPVTGALDSVHVRRESARLIKATERAFNRRLSLDWKNRVERAPA